MLQNPEGEVIARSFCAARGEWMTQEFVPFEGSLQFNSPSSGGRGVLVLKKDNPSDRPELDDALEIPVFFP